MTSLTIVGGGLVGSLLALALKQRGHQVKLYEKRADPRKTGAVEGRSINLVITSRGLEALRHLGLQEEALKLCVAVYGRQMHAKDRTQVFQPYGRDGECNFSVSRSELNHFLLDRAEQAGVELYFDHQLIDLDRDQKTLSFHERSNVSFDYLIATDGAGSAVRQVLRDKYRAFQESSEFLSAGYKELFLPTDQHGKPALNFEALHIWPRGHHMLMALPNLDGSFTMTLYLPHTAATPAFDQLTSAQEIQSYLQTEFPDAYELMPDAIADFQQNPEGKLGTVRLSSWLGSPHILLLGDASHAIVPFFGQGMNSGFEDVSFLLKELEQNGDQFHEAFQAVERERPKNTEAIANMAIENFTEMSEKVGDSNFLLRKKVEAKLEQEFPERYRSRYGMITYTLIPYHLTYQLGLVQGEILERLCKNLDSPDQVDLALADQLIAEKLDPLTKTHQLNFASRLLS